MKTSMLVITLTLATFAAPPASAQSDPAGNLPCNAFCRQWMGGSQPAHQAAPAPREAEPAAPLELNGSRLAVAKPPLATPATVTVTAVKHVRTAKASVTPRRVIAQGDPATVLPPPRPRSLAVDTPRPALAMTAPEAIRSMPEAAPTREAPKTAPRPVDAVASSQVMAMLAPPALPADPVLLVPQQAPAPVPPVPVSIYGTLPMVAEQIAPPAPQAAGPAPVKTSVVVMPPAFDVIATLLLAGPTQP